jgi:hypothetical protein
LWRDVPELARQARFPPHGHYGGQPGANEAALAWKALGLLNQPVNKPEAIQLIRDDDRDTGRRRGFGQARTDARLDIPVVIGFASTKRECWVLAGFDPRDEAENLTAHRDHHELSAKSVLAALTKGNRENVQGKPGLTAGVRSCNTPAPEGGLLT